MKKWEGWYDYGQYLPIFFFLINQLFSPTLFSSASCAYHIHRPPGNPQKKTFNLRWILGGLTFLTKASYVVFAGFNAFDLFVYSLFMSLWFPLAPLWSYAKWSAVSTNAHTYKHTQSGTLVSWQAGGWYPSLLVSSHCKLLIDLVQSTDFTF